MFHCPPPSTLLIFAVLEPGIMLNTSGVDPKGCGKHLAWACLNSVDLNLTVGCSVTEMSTIQQAAQGTTRKKPTLWLVCLLLRALEGTQHLTPVRFPYQLAVSPALTSRELECRKRTQLLIPSAGLFSIYSLTLLVIESGTLPGTQCWQARFLSPWSWTSTSADRQREHASGHFHHRVLRQARPQASRLQAPQ